MAQYITLKDGTRVPRRPMTVAQMGSAAYCNAMDPQRGVGCTKTIGHRGDHRSVTGRTFPKTDWRTEVARRYDFIEEM